MTALYEFPLLVAPISLACPSCGGEAVFRTRHDKPLPVMRAGEAPGRAVADWSGQLHCPACARRSPHVLVWPDQAYYQVEHRGQVLWALDRPMMQTFRNVIAAGADRARPRPKAACGRVLEVVLVAFLDGRKETTPRRRAPRPRTP